MVAARVLNWRGAIYIVAVGAAWGVGRGAGLGLGALGPVCMLVGGL